MSGRLLYGRPPARLPEGLGWGSGIAPAADLALPFPGADATQRRRRRRRWTLLSLLLCTLAPTGFVAAYEYGIAADQYASSFKFVVRQQAPAAAAAGASSVVSALRGNNPMLAAVQDPEVVVAYIRSHQILRDLKGRLSLAQIYGTRRADWLARLDPDAAREQQLRYWRRMVEPYFDLTSGVVGVTVRAFSPQDARTVATAVLGAAEQAVNEMSRAARTHALAYAEANAARGRARLSADEIALATYRNAHSILFPRMAASESGAIVQRLRGQLAQDRATLGTLMASGQGDGSLQVRILRQRIDATGAEIRHLDAAITQRPPLSPASAPPAPALGDPLASVLSGYESLAVNVKLDERLYASDLIALQAARSAAAQQELYLEAFVRPDLPQASTYPRRWLITLEAALVTFVGWCLGMLLLQGLRDHLD